MKSRWNNRGRGVGANRVQVLVSLSDARYGFQLRIKCAELFSVAGLFKRFGVSASPANIDQSTSTYPHSEPTSLPPILNFINFNIHIQFEI